MSLAPYNMTMLFGFIQTCLFRLESSVNSLDIKVNKPIIDNIIYSGIFFRYKGILNGVNNKKNQV